MSWFSSRSRRLPGRKRAPRRPVAPAGMVERLGVSRAGLEPLEQKLPLAVDMDVDVNPGEDVVAITSVSAPRVVAITEAGRPGSRSQVRIIDAESFTQIGEFATFEAGLDRRGG
jgi:hypothetical protein